MNIFFSFCKKKKMGTVSTKNEYSPVSTQEPYELVRNPSSIADEKSLQKETPLVNNNDILTFLQNNNVLDANVENNFDVVEHTSWNRMLDYQPSTLKWGENGEVYYILQFNPSDLKYTKDHLGNFFNKLYNMTYNYNFSVNLSIQLVIDDYYNKERLRCHFIDYKTLLKFLNRLAKIVNIISKNVYDDLMFIPKDIKLFNDFPDRCISIFSNKISKWKSPDKHNKNFMFWTLIDNIPNKLSWGYHLANFSNQSPPNKLGEMIEDEKCPSIICLGEWLNMYNKCEEYLKYEPYNVLLSFKLYLYPSKDYYEITSYDDMREFLQTIKSFVKIDKKQ